MAIQLYTDHNVPRAIVDGLKSRGVDIVTSYEDGTSEFDDLEIIAKAGEPEDIENRVEFLPL